MYKSLLFAGLSMAAATLAPVTSAFAHIAPCPYCGQTIAQDTPTTDNEVALRFGRKRVEYKCVFCALTEAKTQYDGDLSILTPSQTKGEPVKLSRQNGQWSALPTAPFFVAQQASHTLCHITYRAFTNRDAAQSYIDKNKAQLPDASPLTLDQMLAFVDKAVPTK